MAEAAHTSNVYSKLSDRHVVTTTLTSPTDGQTWDTGLATVEHVSLTIVESSGAAGDAIGVASISGPTVTLEVVGTVDSARAMAMGT